MVCFNGILDIGQIEDLKMMKDTLVDGKELEVTLIFNWLELSKMLMVDLMIILFHPILDKFYCFERMNQLKMNIYFFVHIKMSYYQFNRQELLQKAKDRYRKSGGKEKAAEYHITNKEVLKENAKSKCINLYAEEKELKIEYRRNKYRNLTEDLLILVLIFQY